MSFRDKVSEEIKKSKENRSQEQTLEQIEVDFSDTPFVKFNPTSVVRGTFPEKSEGNPIIYFPDEDNTGRKDQGYFGLVMDDVGAVQDDEFPNVKILKTEGDSTDYRIFDLDDHDTKAVEGVGVKYGDRLYEGEFVDEVDGRAIVVVDRTASVSVAKKLDVNGATPADMDQTTGQPNTGLIEYNPENSGPYQRYARRIELRDELFGTEVGVMVSRREEQDESYAERVADPDDNAREMLWYTVFDLETGDTLEPVEGEASRTAFLEWRFDPSAGNLPDEDWEFVREYQQAGLSTDEDNIRSNIEDNLDQLSDDPNADRMVALIQNGASS